MALRGTLTHWKTRLLAEELKIDAPFALGLLEALWHVTAKDTPTGCIGHLSNHGIAMRLFTSINPDVLINALLKSGHLEKHPEHRLIIHDWSEHSDDAVDNRLARHGLYYADGRQPRMRRMRQEERERVSARFGFLLANRTEFVRTEHHGPPQHTTEHHDAALPEARGQKPDASSQLRKEDLENVGAVEQSSASSIDAGDDVAAYVERVSKIFTARKLTPQRMSKADQKLAEKLCQDGVPVEKIERAIWLGCARKMAASANNGHPGNIASLRYFMNLLEEPELETAGKPYWQHVERKIKRWEHAQSTP